MSISARGSVALVVSRFGRPPQGGVEQGINVNRLPIRRPRGHPSDQGAALCILANDNSATRLDGTYNCW